MGNDAPVERTRDPLAEFFDALAGSWDHAASMVQRTFAGTYGTDDAVADVALCTGRAAQLSIASLAGVMSMLSPGTVRQAPTTASVTIADPNVGPLHAGPFRGIGWGAQFLLPAAAVTLQQTPGAAGAAGTVTVTFLWDHVNDPEQRSRTVIYEGRLQDIHATPVGDTIRIPKPAH